MPHPAKHQHTIDREPEIIHLLAEGFQAAEIAEKLFMRKESLEHQLWRLRKERGARNTTHLVVAWLREEAKEESK